MKIGSRTKPIHKIQLAKVGNIPDSRLEPGYNGWIRADLHQMLFRLAILLIAAFPIFSASIAMAADSGNSPSDSLDAFTMVMGLLGGLALFLFGMEQMSDALKAVAGDQMKTLLAKLTTNPFFGALTGAFVTAVIQSSSVTTVLIVGFISAGLMTLSQGVGVIFGANVGTTITAQIVAFKITKYALLMIAIGFAMLFASKNERGKHYGEIIMGLGLIFFGMGVMSNAMKPLRSYEPFIDLMKQMENPIFGIMVSAVFTGLVQSSSATTGIVIVMASQGFITLTAGIALIFGANIGTCVTAMLASIGKPREAVRAAIVHVFFNVAGVLLWVAFIGPLADLVTRISPVVAGISGTEKLAAECPRQIANAHTIFNIVNTLVFLPFAGVIARLVVKVIPETEEIATEKPTPKMQFITEDLLSTPVIAIEQARFELIRMGEIVREMLQKVLPTFIENNRESAEEILEQESLVDYIEYELTRFLSAITGGNVTLQQSERAFQMLHLAKVIEHISAQISRDLVPISVKKTSRNIEFSEEGREELIRYHTLVLENYARAVQVIANQDRTAAKNIVSTQTELDEIESIYRRTHYNRLSQGFQESVDSSHFHLDFLSYLQQINTFAKTIASTILEE